MQRKNIDNVEPKTVITLFFADLEKITKSSCENLFCMKNAKIEFLLAPTSQKDFDLNVLNFQLIWKILSFWHFNRFIISSRKAICILNDFQTYINLDNVKLNCGCHA